MVRRSSSTLRRYSLTQSFRYAAETVARMFVRERASWFSWRTNTRIRSEVRTVLALSDHGAEVMRGG